MGVQGVGPQVALAILAGIEAGELVRAIAARRRRPPDRRSKGVGSKTAERLALELREKILTVGAGQGARRRRARRRGRRTACRAGPLGEVYGALVTLGYKPGRDRVADRRRWTPARPPADPSREALAALRRR